MIFRLETLFSTRRRHASWPAYLIDLDLAIKERRERPSGAEQRLEQEHSCRLVCSLVSGTPSCMI
jgi:hypothetical protein